MFLSFEYVLKFKINITTLFSTTSDYTLKAAPPISEEYTAIASKITTAFLGDPSFFAYNGEEAEAEHELLVLVRGAARLKRLLCDAGVQALHIGLDALGRLRRDLDTRLQN